MDWNWLEVICTQVMCGDVSHWMCEVYQPIFVWGYVQSILHGKYIPVSEACINI